MGAVLEAHAQNVTMKAPGSPLAISTRTLRLRGSTLRFHVQSATLARENFRVKVVTAKGAIKKRMPTMGRYRNALNAITKISGNRVSSNTRLRAFRSVGSIGRSTAFHVILTEFIVALQTHVWIAIGPMPWQ